MQKFDYLKSVNANYIDELFERYHQDPTSIDASWRYFFDGLELGNDEVSRSDVKSNGHARENGSASRPVTQGIAPTPTSGAVPSVDFSSEARVAELIMAYRELGRLLANIDPLSAPPSSHPLLELSHFGLSPADLNKKFTAGRLIGLGTTELSVILTHLKETYCSSIGVEYTHIQDPTERQWLQNKMEATKNREALDSDTQKWILSRLTESEGFEKFLHTRYVAQKRFSIEGGEGLIPTLDCIFENGAELGAKEFVIGMAHRGRLNVLTNIFGKQPEYIFTEFEGSYKADLSLGEGDVKYHMGFSADITTRKNKKLHLSLGSNPSHLEFINPVIEGVARAKQGYLKDTTRSGVIPIAIHGDAAFAGQGVCYETLNLSQLEGYGTGGTINIVINNQVGFTTSPKDSRSTTYATDVAKMLEVPIFHVNGDDIEALWYTAKICIEYRQKFKKDVVIDLVCYRRHGHNEGDEPSFTQPLLYKKIKNHPTPREVYAQRLIQGGRIEATLPEELLSKQMDKLSAAQAKTKAEAPKPYVSAFDGQWKSLRRATDEDHFKPVKTGVSEETLLELSRKLNKMPSGFQLHSKLTRFFEARLKAVEEGKGIDWGNAETLAFASLVNEGHGVRLSGQDAERGTFTHRHSVVHDFETGQTYTALNHLSPNQALYDVHNSHLSEMAVMGFEYGYSLADPQVLVIWEAQFGDFANGAQVMIDQFISSSESKWQRMSGLVLLLPHGFEGQGPEHSSARLERFLQLCGKQNLIVCNLTTPAQIFHALRRQVKREFRKPMVIMSPKSLLRNPMAISTLKDLAQGTFEEVLDDASIESTKQADSVKRVVLCTGKLYYELLAERTQQKRTDVALIRLEQLYPFAEEKVAKILNRYKKAEIIWAQEEPRNMGSWSYIYNIWSGGYEFFQEKVGGRSIRYVGRDFGAAPAVGSHKIHEQEQKTLIQKAFL